MKTETYTGLKKVKMTKRAFKIYLNDFYNVKYYNDFGNEEYKVFTSNGKEIGAIDINTNEIYVP